tara:strand:+ start:682 stop:870 length:189 start_codon:yes stop_codon:yes gene_type:complete
MRSEYENVVVVILRNHIQNYKLGIIFLVEVVVFIDIMKRIYISNVIDAIAENDETLLNTDHL